MKTNIIMNRPMGLFNVEQRTSDGYFEANSLLSQWNNVKDNPRRDMNKYLSSSKTIEFINVIKSKSQKSELADYQAVIIKKGKAMKNGGRSRDEIYMHPYLFIDFSMWINPSFKYDVLKFVYDKMIDYRNKAGDAYKTLATNVQKLVGSNFMPIAMRRIGEAINWIIFNCHEKDLRNKFGSEEKQNELYIFEIKVATLIDEEFITSYDDLIKYLRNQYARRHKPF